MYRRAFILTFDRDDNLNYKDIHDNIITSPSVITWWHYIKSSYILIVDTNDVSKLNKEIVNAMPDKRFLLIEVNLKSRNGWLPPKAWEWIKAQSVKLK